MIRKMADNDDDLFVADTTFNLDGFVDVLKDGTVMDEIWEYMSEDDREEAWQGFLESLKDDFNTFYNETDFCSTVEDIENNFDDRDIDDDAYLGLFDIVEDYVIDKLYDDFINTEASDDVEVYQKTGGEFLDKLYGIFKGKHITVTFSAEAGEIK